MIPYANTNEMKEVADDIKALANQLSETFDALYKRLSEVPEGTQEWIGGKANYYFATICSDKEEHKSICTELEALANEIESEALTLEEIASEANQE